MASETDELVRLATVAYSRAYDKYSGVKVGAAVLVKSGKIFLGCNVENAAKAVTNCAERVAVQSAFANGKTEIVKVAIYSDTFRHPCGYCCLALKELCNSDTMILLINDKGQIKEISVKHLKSSGGTNANLRSAIRGV